MIFSRFQPLTILLLVVFFSSSIQAQFVDTDFFKPGSLKGWGAGRMDYWKVEGNEIIGSSTTKVERNQFLWSEVEVADFYLSIDVKLDPNDCNAGIQFRSRQDQESGQAIGYQADIGKDVWGRLYHEHGREKLDWSDRGEAAVKPGKWNRYEILAVGDRIWTAINGRLAVSVRDPEGDRSGFIALQIHSGEPQTVRYRINKLVHNPPVKLAGFTENQLNKELKNPLDFIK